jgi:chorismate mutase
MDSAAAGREATLAALIRLRLDVMPSVAAAKRTAGLPLVDEAQESRVIERVRACRPSRRTRRRCIASSSNCRRRCSATPAGTNAATLAELRDAIARIDAQLVRELDRTPAEDVDVWQPALMRSLIWRASSRQIAALRAACSANRRRSMEAPRRRLR